MKTITRDGIVEVTAIEEFKYFGEIWFIYDRKDINENTGLAVVHKKTGLSLPIKVRIEHKEAAKEEAKAFLSERTLPRLRHTLKNGRIFLAEQDYPYPLNGDIK